ncbi:ArsA family ATPase [Treponema pedis]|uniref:ArsA family ATPase n=1 Tax=Treponema pedis TaxID=409322 RepID=UPI00041DD2CC|nr:ArsA family ATPase [Treponema pedis]
MRILIYTGKGGVGKTSIAAATSLHLANSGKRVLIISTDQAHSLSDSFGIQLSYKPVEICKNLDAMEIDPAEEGKKAWGNLSGYLRQIISSKANNSIETEEALLFTGLDEIFSLLCVLDVYEKDEYDVIIMDCAPTGQTLALLSYSEKFNVLTDSILPMVRNINTALGSLISKKTSVPKPKDAVFEEVVKLAGRLNRLQKILRTREITSVRIVTTPEQIVIEEARRSYTWLQLYDFGVDAIYMNKIYPEKALKNRFKSWAFKQEESIKLVRESFSEQKFFQLELQEDELLGMEKLLKAARIMYGESDPFQVFCSEIAFSIEEVCGTRIFVINLPFADEKSIFVLKEKSDIVLSFRNETRRFSLPDNLKRRNMTSYFYKDGRLRISFDY